MSLRPICFILLLLFFTSCYQTRIHEKPEWSQFFEENGIPSACFMIRDHTHEEIFYYNEPRSLARFSPAETFEIIQALTGLEDAILPTDQSIIPWDSIVRSHPEWNRDMNLRDAFLSGNPGFFQQVEERIGIARKEHYLDTLQYGNRNPQHDSLKISADEQLGLIKRLYFDELPFSDRSQRITRSLMLQESTDHYRLYYKTGKTQIGDSVLYWLIGFTEMIEMVEEPKESLNKTGIRNYPYFFVQNFTIPAEDSGAHWDQTALNIARKILIERNALPYPDF